MSEYLRTALELATAGVPVLPLRSGKLPFGNCPACRDNACGDRPHMKRAGACVCPAPCHGWAAATTDTTVLTSPPWAGAWREARAVAYYPGGAGLTVVDLDNAAAVAWARESLPPTRIVATTRGEHWIYLGAMRSANNVRPGVDIKSLMQYARWLGSGTGTIVRLPDAVRALVEGEETTPPAEGWSLHPGARRVGCLGGHRLRHTERYVRTGLERGTALIRSRSESGAGSQAFGVAQFLARQHAQCPGPCGLDVLGSHIISVAVSVGVPEAYAARAVANGLGRAA